MNRNFNELLDVEGAHLMNPVRMTTSDVRRMSRRRAALVMSAALAASLLATSAEAAIVGTATLVRDPSIGLPFTSPDDALGAPWVSYKLRLRTTAGEIIQAAQFDSTGALHQRWNFGVDENAFLPTAASSNQSNGDSHLLPRPGSLFGSGPTEDNPGTGSPLPSIPEIRRYGVGTTLQGAWATPAGTTVQDIAYLVVPKGGVPLDFRVKVATPTGAILGDLRPFDFQLTQPTISVTGNALAILDGDSTPNLLDATDFGSAPLAMTKRQVFTIQNTSDVLLSLGQPTLTGPFSLLGTFPNTIAEGQSATFEVGFNSTSLGLFSGSITFATNVLGMANPFSFDLAAQAVPEPSSATLALFVLVGLGAIRQRRNS